jgi:hypothetical protein
MTETLVAVGALCAEHIGCRVSLAFGADAVSGALYDVKHTEHGWGDHREVRCYVYLKMGEGLNWFGTLPSDAIARVSPPVPGSSDRTEG